jgi:hypothetical protein
MEMSGQIHTPVALYPREMTPDIHCVEGGVGPRAGLDVMEKRKISHPYRESNPDSSVVQAIA